MANPFDQFDTPKAKDGGNPFDQFDTSPSAAAPAPVAAPAQPSFMERVKNAVTPGPDTLKNTVIGIGAGMYKVGKGAQQLISEAGSHIPFIPEHMRQEAAARAETAKQERESAISDFAPLRQESTAAKVGEFVGEVAPTMVIPGGVTGGALKRAGTAALAGAGIGAVMEPEAPVTGAVKGAAFGAAGSALVSGAGRVINALTGKVERTGLTDLSEQYKIPLTLAEETKGGPSRTDVMLERAPSFLGSKGFRAEQQEAAHNAAKDFLGKYIADPAAPDIEQGNREFASNLFEKVKGLVSQVPNQAIAPTETREIAQDLLSRYPDIFKRFQDVKTEGLLNDIVKGTAPVKNTGGLFGATSTAATTPKTLSFDEMWTLRQGLGEKIGQARLMKQRGEIDNTAYSQLKSLFGAVSNDIDGWATQIGKPEISSQFKAANDAYKTFVVKHDILSRAYDKVVKDVGENTFFSPQKFSTELGKLVGKNKYTKQFTAAEINEMTGLANIMQVVKRSGQFMENQPTANRWGPAALGLDMGETAYQVAHMTGALKTAGVAAIVTGAVKLLTTTTIGKRLAMAASKYNPQGRAMARIVNEIYSLVPKAAAVGGEQATAPAPGGMVDGGQIPGRVIPGQGDVTETPTEPGEYITPVDAIISKGRELNPDPNLTELDAHSLGKQWFDQETARLKQMAGNPTPPNNSGVNIGFKEGGMVRKEKTNALSKRETGKIHANGSAQQSGSKESGGSSVSRERLRGIGQRNETSVSGSKAQPGKQEAEKGNSRPLTLVPAVKKNGKLYKGKAGDEHIDIIDRYTLGRKATNNEYGFVTPQGKFLTRDQAMDWLEKSKPAVYKSLQERGINELRSRDLINDKQSGKATETPKVTPRKSRKDKMIEEEL